MRVSKNLTAIRLLCCNNGNDDMDGVMAVYSHIIEYIYILNGGSTLYCTLCEYLFFCLKIL